MEGVDREWREERVWIGRGGMGKGGIGPPTFWLLPPHMHRVTAT